MRSGAPFLVGVNLPWIRYGGDFGANAWHPDGGVHVPAVREQLERACGQMADAGLELVRWFVLADGRAGLVEDAAGRVMALDGHVRRDLDVALTVLGRQGLRAIFVLTDYLLCAPAQIAAGVQTGGRRHLVARRDDRERFVACAIDPLVRHAAASDVVYAWDVMNEPEWVTWGEGTWRFWRSVSAIAMQEFLRAGVACIHGAGARATVGLASSRGLDLVRGLGLDLYQVHWYDHVIDRAGLAQRVASFDLDAPLLLGEFPSRGSACAVGEVLSLARSAGYSGALAWSLLANDRFSAAEACVDGAVAWRNVGRK